MNIKKVVTVFLCMNFVLSLKVFNKIMVQNQDALCLDGTLGAYYANQGCSSTKFLISFEGGGWCANSYSINTTYDYCYERSLTDLGSSSKYPQIWTQADGILSDDSRNLFRDFNIFHLKYCDGTGHQGYRKNPVIRDGRTVYFRGHNVTKAQLDSIDKYYGLWKTATEVVITGQSAGGLATFLWANYISSKLPKAAKVWAIPDSGIFLDSAVNYYTQRNVYKLQIQNFMAFSNVQTLPPVDECNAAYPGQEYKCMLAQYIHPFIKVPLFPIQSPYDSWAIPNMLGISCRNQGSLLSCNQSELKHIEDYAANTSLVLSAIGKKKENGYWAPACSFHVFSTWSAFYASNFRIPFGSAFSIMYSISLWYAGTIQDNNHKDQGSWPINSFCSGL